MRYVIYSLFNKLKANGFNDYSHEVVLMSQWQSMRNDYFVMTPSGSEELLWHLKISAVNEPEVRNQPKRNVFLWRPALQIFVSFLLSGGWWFVLSGTWFLVLSAWHTSWKDNWHFKTYEVTNLPGSGKSRNRRYLHVSSIRSWSSLLSQLYLPHCCTGERMMSYFYWQVATMERKFFSLTSIKIIRISFKVFDKHQWVLFGNSIVCSRFQS